MRPEGANTRERTLALTGSRVIAAWGGAAVLAVAFATPAAAQTAPTFEAVPAPVDTSRINDLFASENRKSTLRLQLPVGSRKAAGQPPAPVPLFVPPEIVDPGVARSGQKRAAKAAEGEPVLHLGHGYVAEMAFERFDVTVRGSNQVFTEGGPGRKAAAPPAPTPDYIEAFEEDYAGGRISFGFAGAHYSVEFECREPDANGEQALQAASCIDEPTAKKIVDDLLLCSATDGRCLTGGAKHIQPK